MNIAIIKNEIVENVIVADSLELAKNLTQADEVLDADKNQISIGWFKINGKWCSPRPYESWTLDEYEGTWVPPIPKPDINSDFYIWNEEKLQWDNVLDLIQ